MSDFLKKCEEYFSTKCFYEILRIEKDANQQDIKKAYHRLSLLVHPDRVEPSNKEIATEKFKVLGKIYSILQDDDRRKCYDDNGEFDDEFDSDSSNWMDYWRAMFKPIKTEDIDAYKKEYIGSENELRDIKKSYVNSEGNMDFILESVMFADCSSEPRIIEIVRKLVDDGEVEEYKQFFNEPKRKRDRRHKKWEDEKKEFEKLNISIEQVEEELKRNSERRAREFSSLISDLEKKYSKPAKRKALRGGSPVKKKKNSKKI
ncbi:J domain-containing protein CG6693 [Onthophagus taurus]|uniref:J domain-containing protein CG6693 n=1 Tax=Onthophagus taurus TaxID=166361 RepID=UPI000C1FF778|nr:J domain-containing protein CG6693 [Onthophagus taurus]